MRQETYKATAALSGVQRTPRLRSTHDRRQTALKQSPTFARRIGGRGHKLPFATSSYRSSLCWNSACDVLSTTPTLQIAPGSIISTAPGVRRTPEIAPQTSFHTTS